MTTTDNNAVQLGALDTGTWFPCYDDGQRWNGAACPAFTAETVQAVMDHYGALLAAQAATFGDDDYDRVNWDGRDLIVSNPVAETCERITPDEHGRYALGACAWTWLARSEVD